MDTGDNITDQQKKILDKIRHHWESKGYGPSIRDLMLSCKYRSPRAVSFHLEKLETLGLIERNREARSLRIKRDQEEIVTLPVFGEIPAGYSAVQSQLPLGELAVPREMAPARTSSHSYALKVRGDSMVGAGVKDGDIAIVEQRQAKPGDIVVALVDGANTLKRLVVRNGGYALKAENPKYPLIIPVEELEIQGVVIGFFRKF